MSMREKEEQKSEKFLYLAVAGIFLIIVSPALLADGMFVDGLIYATISKNLATGLGSFWHLHFTDSIFPVFSTHPPLAFGLESLFYDLLGTSRFTEHIYSLVLVFLTTFIIIMIWKSVTALRNGGWIPVFIWIAMPSVTWAAANNMLENTLDLFICLSVLFYIMSLKRNRIIFLIMSGFMLSCGFMTKGLITLFPLSLPFFFWLFTGKRKFLKIVADTFIILLSAIVPVILIFYLIPDARAMLTQYLGIVFDLTKNAATKDSRFYILNFLLKELIPAASIVIVILIYGKWKKYDFSLLKTNLKSSLAFLFLGLSGVVPIMITRMQSGYYLVPGLAFFAIAFALFIHPFIEKILTAIKNINVFNIISIALLSTGIVLCIYFSGRICRDRNMINDMKIISSVVPDNSTIGILPDMVTYWNLHGYYGRYHNITLDAELSHNHEFLLVHNPLGSDTLSKSFEKRELGTSEYSLYRRVR
jgi:4-amino-4-deoxy-L-arabinose transferase-like glycosyltransferase